MTSSEYLQQETLRSFGAIGSQVEELHAYNRAVCIPADSPLPQCPLPDEPFVEAWRQYAAECAITGNILPLRKYLVQLNFPIEAGIGSRSDYQAATRAGRDVVESPVEFFVAPKRCCVVIHSTAAGSIPLVIADEREDFVSLARALSLKNEPIHVPDSMGGCIIAGYNNWHRFHMVQSGFSAFFPDEPLDLTPPEQFKRIVQHRNLDQDRFILLSDGPYSGVVASQVGLSQRSWREYSLIIRREHECAHYFTRRLLQSMRNNIFDELIADYSGIVSAIGHYRADWGLLFLGLERESRCRPGGRFENYFRESPLSAGSVSVLQRLVRKAACNLELIDRAQCNARNWPVVQPACMIALSTMSIEELASEQAEILFSASLNQFAICNELSAEVV